MKPRFCVILMLLTFELLVFVPNSFAQETSAEHVVRVVYFVPKDRQSQQDIDTKLDLLMKDAQQSYTEVMENHGFGRKTFPLETDKDGKVIVHHVTGSFPDVYYHTESFNKVEKEIRQWFDPTTNVYFTVLDVSTEYIDGAYCGQGADRGSYGGMSLMPASGVCFTVAIAARQTRVHLWNQTRSPQRSQSRPVFISLRLDGYIFLCCRMVECPPLLQRWRKCFQREHTHSDAFIRCISL